MDKDFETSITEFKINLIEYCTLKEDLIIPDHTEAKISIHKLMPFCGEGEPTTTDSIFINDAACKPRVSGSISLTDKLTVPILNGNLPPAMGEPIYSDMIDQEGDIVKVQTGGKIKKGALMMVLFMDNNIHDPYLTLWRS